MSKGSSRLLSGMSGEGKALIAAVSDLSPYQEKHSRFFKHFSQYGYNIRRRTCGRSVILSNPHLVYAI